MSTATIDDGQVMHVAGPAAAVIPPVENGAFLLGLLATFGIKSRLDLSFTATSDDAGIRSNWSVPHDSNGYCGDTMPIGKRLFLEVEALAVIDESEAFDAIVFAITARDWNRTADGTGWGIELGFSQRLAELAIIGMRTVREGGEA